MPKKIKPKKPVPLRLQWDETAKRYRDAKTGRFLSRSTVETARDAIAEDARIKLRAISEQLRNGKITLPEWQTQFKDIIRAGHTLAAGIAMGGKANMTPADWGRVGQMLKQQYAALNNFTLQLEQGRAIHLGRVDQYAKSIRATFINAERLRFPFQAMARWVRSAKESCDGCRTQSDRGVQPVISFPAIGSNECRYNCRCRLEYVAKA